MMKNKDTKKKVTKQLIKLYKIYDDIDIDYLGQNDFTEIRRLKSAIAYMICDTKQLNMAVILHDNNFLHYSILIDYIYNSETGKQYLEELIKREKDDVVNWDADVFKDRSVKDGISYIIDNDNNNFYYWNGKNFINMC